MTPRSITKQLLVFTVQWILMLLGFYLLTAIIAPARLFEPTFPLAKFVDAGLKGLAALAMSAFWLFLWDRQIRFLFFKREQGPIS